jgi:hypothetical protein
MWDCRGQSASVLPDHFGVVGLRQHTALPGRLAGCSVDLRCVPGCKILTIVN